MAHSLTDITKNLSIILYTEWRMWSRAADILHAISHAHLVSKYGSVISRKSLSPVFKWSGI